MRGKEGFTLLETLVALSLLALGVLFFLQASALAVKLHHRSARGTEALLAAQEVMELLLAAGWEGAVASLNDGSEAAAGGDGTFSLERKRGRHTYRVLLERGDSDPRFHRYRVTCSWREFSGGRESERSLSLSATGRRER